jgi:hypothetical protein
MAMVSTLHAPELQQHPARQKAELNFVMRLRLAYLDATDEPPSLTADPRRPGPFARMVQHCLNEVKASGNAVALLNELQQMRKAVTQDEAMSDQQPPETRVR